MTTLEAQVSLDGLDAETDAIETFIAHLDTGRLQMINDLVYQELVLRYEGKPLDRNRLH